MTLLLALLLAAASEAEAPPKPKEVKVAQVALPPVAGVDNRAIVPGRRAG
jgi:hypothetical protein